MATIWQADIHVQENEHQSNTRLYGRLAGGLWDKNGSTSRGEPIRERGRRARDAARQGHGKVAEAWLTRLTQSGRKSPVRAFWYRNVGRRSGRRPIPHHLRPGSSHPSSDARRGPKAGIGRRAGPACYVGSVIRCEISSAPSWACSNQGHPGPTRTPNLMATARTRDWMAPKPRLLFESQAC